MANVVGPFQIKRGTSSQWADSNVPLRSGEPGWDTTRKRLKIGDGSTLFSGLPWALPDSTTIQRLEELSAEIEEATSPGDALTAAILSQDTVSRGVVQGVVREGVGVGKQPWLGKLIYLYGDSISSTDYTAYATTLAAKTGATVVRGGWSGATASALTATSRLDAVVAANPDLIILMTSGNDNGAAGTVGTFISTPSNGESIKTDPDISAPYAGSSFIEAVAYIARYLIARRYLYGTKFLYLGGLPQHRNSHSVSDPWNNPLNHQRKSDAVREVCSRYHMPFLDTLNACAWDMSSEPFWTSPTDKTTVNGVYTMDGLHPSPDGYDRLTDAIADVVNNALTAKAPTPAVPPRVTGVAATEVLQNRFTLSWNSMLRTLDYQVQYRAVGAADWSSLSATYNTTATVTGLTPSTAYEARVIARNPTGAGQASTTLGVTTANPATLPAQVTGLATGAATAKSVRLSWNAISNADGYRIDYRQGSSGSWITFGSVSGTSGTVTGLTPSTSHQFRVAATNAAGTGTFSDTVTASTTAKIAIADNFDRSDSATTMGSSSTGNRPWIPLTAGSVFGIQSGQAYRVTAAGSNENAVVVDSEFGDIDMSFTCAVRASGGFGPVFRATDENNYWLVDATGAGWRVYKRVAGAFTPVGYANTAAATSGDVVRVITSGDSISVSVNGGAALTVSDSFNRDASMHGFRVSGATASGVRADNISIT